MLIALSQFNPIVGNIEYNQKKMLHDISEAKKAGARLIVFPELAVCGYPPEDLLLRPSFYQDCLNSLNELAKASEGIALVIGHPEEENNERFNAVTVFDQQTAIAHYRKLSLPNNEVFDEYRYFSPGGEACVFTIDGTAFGVNICEDIWHPEAADRAKLAGAEVLLVPNASPYHKDKEQERVEIAKERVKETGLALLYCNWVGGQDELVFDGGSFALNTEGELIAHSPLFEEHLLFIECAGNQIQSETKASWPSTDAALYQALVLGVRDYIQKNRFPGVLLGLSGGVDSGLTLAVAIDALGADKVHAVMMPSKYTADISVIDSREMIERVKCQYSELDIWPMYEQFVSTLSPEFEGRALDTTEENIQARVRGTLLMALSNKTGKLVLTTGNKSEMTTGYCTLYGDMAGGFAVLKDVSKMTVYRLCEYRNQTTIDGLANPIPERIITRPPSAELRPDQKDQDSLPPYEVLDAIMEAYVERNQSMADIIASGYQEADVVRVVKLLKINEYKRRQAPVGIRITPRGFGKDWRYPITNGYFA
ncbi:NAD+ synthase [Leeia sp. TBRC 13508]|uniref:Glutamine-dependent NAD(+) synthetase n=1 Tax=Leeia speluncae TaxID=2884804 RepID=A0ABS8DAP6_9NEIS|nr:NAD+ synthase [Leeia speluncae]MCB6185207.1 NAD+ synthase [Leeia speluncae]